MIKCPVEGHFKGACYLHQIARTLHIDRAVFVQHTQHRTTRTEQAQMFQVLAHDIEITLCINEVTAARTQQNMHRQPTATYSFAN